MTERTRWEYMIVDAEPDVKEMQNQLTTLGVRCWELVSATAVRLPIHIETQVGATGMATTEVVAHTFFLKRPMLPLAKVEQQLEASEEASSPPSTQPPAQEAKTA